MSKIKKPLGVLIILYGSIANAAPLHYDFIEIADSFAYPSLSSVAINNQGDVAFNTGSGIYAGNGVSVTTLIDNSGSIGAFGAIPISFSNTGIVSFSANNNSSGSGGVYSIGGGNPLRTISQQSRRPSSVNDVGTVAYIKKVFGNFPGSNSTSGPAIKGQIGGEPSQLLYDISDPFLDGFTHPLINNNGELAFIAGLDAGGSGVYTGTGGPLTTIADSSGAYSSFGSISLNDVGQVAFTGILDSGAAAISIGDGGTFSTFDGDDLGFSIFGTPSLNIHADLTFRGVTDSGDNAIYFASDNNFERILGIGDLISGHEILQFGLFQESLNDLGQIGFMARLSDSSTRVYLADPASTVPAPAAIWLFGTGLLGLIGFSKRRKAA